MKHGHGVYIFEDNSSWIGQWENDQPVEEDGNHAFAAKGACPQTYVEDLLQNECDRQMARKGTQAAILQ